MMRLTCILIAAITILSCNGVDNPKVQFLKWAQVGAITEDVKCKADPDQSYSLYLPSNYDVNKVYPTIYAFDPHGKGRIPLALMRNVAERLGYIVIGSNNSKNGLSSEEISGIVNSLFTDSQLKLAVDSKRVYLLGFSGGARIACMVAQEKGGVAGVIACSGGFQPTKNPLGFRFIGIAGVVDMNYLELRRLSVLMDSAGIQNQFITFNGKHQWPDESTLSEALTLFDIQAKPKFPSNKKIADDYLNINIKRIHNLKANNCSDSLALAYSIANRTYQTLNEMVDVAVLKQTVDELRQNQILQQYLKEQIMVEAYEQRKQEEFSSSFGSKPEVWWNNEIKKLNTPAKGLMGDVSKRLLGYISLSCYGYVNGALRYQDWKATKYFTAIYVQVDPENPDSWYAMACLQANTGKADDAIESLSKAVRYGLTNLSKIKNDPLLTAIRGRQEFNAIIKRNEGV